MELAQKLELANTSEHQAHVELIGSWGINLMLKIMIGGCKTFEFILLLIPYVVQKAKNEK